MKNKRRTFFYSITMFSTLFLSLLLSLLFVLIPMKGNGAVEGISNSFEDTMVVLNSPIEMDNGFNELTLQGAANFSLDTKEYLEKQYLVGKIAPESYDNFSEYYKIIDYSYDEGAEVVVSSGYNTIPSLVGSMNYDTNTRNNNGIMFTKENKDKYFVIVDDSTYEANLARNVISIKFAAEECGFLAGVAASVYATSNESYLVSTYGGFPYSTVIDWLSGYEQGINWFNYEVFGILPNGEKDVDHKPWIEESKDWIHITNGTSMINYTNVRTNTEDWFSGSFDIGGSSLLAAQQVDAGSTVIFPVAGGQTADSINVAQTYNNINSEKWNDNVRVIGIDSDASNIYTSNHDELLGSAIKNIEEAVELGLWYTNIFINEFGQNEEMVCGNSFNEEIFLKVSTPVSEGGWQEDDEDIVYKDLARMRDDEIYDYVIKGDDIFVESDDIDYTHYGQKLEYGSFFIGKYNNGGLDFVYDEVLIDSYEIMLSMVDDDAKTSTGGEIPNSIDDLFIFSLEQNEIIEKISPTFSEFTNDIMITYYGLYPWIPDWEGYIGD